MTSCYFQTFFTPSPIVMFFHASLNVLCKLELPFSPPILHASFMNGPRGADLGPHALNPPPAEDLHTGTHPVCEELAVTEHEVGEAVHPHEHVIQGLLLQLSGRQVQLVDPRLFPLSLTHVPVLKTYNGIYFN